MNLFKCSRCGFIAHIYVQNWTRLCPICRGVFVPPGEEDEEDLRLFNAIQAILGGGGFFA